MINLSILSLLAGCGGTPEGTALLTAEQSYDFSNVLFAQSTVITSGVDTTINWSNLTVDQLGREMSPDSIDTMLIVRFEALSHEEVIQGAADDCIEQPDISGVVELHPEEGQVSANLTDFSFMGYEIDPAEQILEGMGSFLITAYSDDAIGVRMMHFIEPEVGADASTVELENGVASVDLSMDIDAGTPLPLNTTSIDWAGLELDTPCGTFPLNRFDRLTVVKYDDLTIADVENDFLYMDTIGTDVWNADIEGLSLFDLTTMTSETGAPFDGFTPDSLWLVALRCMTCDNPAPPYIAVVDAE